MISATRLTVLCFVSTENFSLPLRRCQAAAKQRLVSALARRSEAHKYNVQMQVRQLQRESRRAISLKDRGNCHRDFLREANQAIGDQQEILVTEVALKSMETR